MGLCDQLDAAAGLNDVQVRFNFDAIDGAGNTHFGWFVDDIAIGHDNRSAPRRT